MTGQQKLVWRKLIEVKCRSMLIIRTSTLKDGHASTVLGATDRSGFRLGHLQVKGLTLFSHDDEVGSGGISSRVAG